MQFKHPEILYFLGLLIIPILVHLFQLQRFVKVPFTNVAFLQKLVLQTRKSSQLKKWLILATRLLLLAALITAFSQPYFSNHKVEEQQSFNIFLDNSLSTNAVGEKGNLLQIASQEIIEHLSNKVNYSLATHDNFYKNKTASELKDILLNITNTAKNTKLKDVILKFSPSKENTNTVIISDFQNIKTADLNTTTPNTTLIKIAPEQKSNLSVDSIFVNDNGSSNFNIHALIKNQGIERKNVPIAIYNQNKLVNKQTFSIEENNSAEVIFSIVKSPLILGKIDIDFNDTYNFDNSFYFTINSNKKTNILAIGESSSFLSRIYTKEEFNYTNSTLQNVNYNLIPKQHLIVLNEIQNISQALINSLNSFVKNGGNLVVIPNKELALNSYNNLFKKLNIGSLLSKKLDSLKITDINYNHPLLKNVFEKKIKNFQYPFVKTSFNSLLKNATNVISFENKQGFIKQVNAQNSSVFWVAAPLDNENSNFLNSPLIVPVFYNIGKQSLQLSELYYTTGKQNTIDVNKHLGKDEILSIKNDNSSFIPLQQTFQNKVRITTNEQPLIAGFYKITEQNNVLKYCAFNYSKQESSLNFLDVTLHKNTTISNSVKNTFENINNQNKIQWLWKWFLALAIVSLFAEILILKFFKP